MATIVCPACQLRSMDATASICRQCMKTLEVALVNVAAYYADVDTLRSRQQRFGTAGGGRSEGDPIGFDLRFDRQGKGTLAVAATRNTVTTWVRYVLDHVPPAAGPACYAGCLHMSCNAVRKTRPPRDNVVSCCEYLGRWVDWFRVSIVGAEVLEEVLAAEKALRRLVDRPPDRWFAGVCSAALMIGSVAAICPQTLYAYKTEGSIACPACKAEHDVKDRRAWLLAAAEEYELTATELARAIVVLDDTYIGNERSLANRIRKWAQRRQILAVRHDVVVLAATKQEIRRPLYRVADVLDMLADDAVRTEERRVEIEAKAARRKVRHAEKQAAERCA